MCGMEECQGGTVAAMGGRWEVKESIPTEP